MIFKVFVGAVCDDNVGLARENVEILDNFEAVETFGVESWFVNNNFNLFSAEGVNDVLNRAGAEIVGAGFHG